MSKFSLFQGNYKRKPDQKVGGRFRPIETRETTLMKANLERQMREQERTRAAAIGIASGLKRHESSTRTQFGPTRKIYEGFSIRNDLISNMLQDNCALLRLRLIIEKGFMVFSEPMPTGRTIVLRLLETFTDWNKIDDVRKTLSTKSPATTDKVMAIIWSHLVLNKNFFERYKEFLLKKLEVSDAESARISLQHYDYTVFYQRFLEVIRRLGATSRKFEIGKEVYVTKELVQNLLLELAKSLSSNWVQQSAVSRENAVVEYVICPCVAKELAMEQEGRTLWSDEWLQVIRKIVELLTVPNDGVLTSVQLRPVMYIFLIMNRCKDDYQTLTSPSELFRTLNLLLPAIDNRTSVFSESVADEDYDEDEYLDDIRDYDMKPLEEMELAKDFFADRQKIYDELKIIFKKTKLNKELSEFTVEMWNILYPVVSCLIGISLHRTILEFEFLKRMTFERAFVRSMFRHVLGKSNRTIDELVVLGWLMTNLMKYLYDGEFLHRNPINKEELLSFIRIIEDTYVDIILSDKDVVDPTVNNAKEIIAQTLVNIHDRNKRIHLYSEDLFLSTKFSVVFPMETHGIKFVHFNKQQRPDSNLSLLDQRLLRVLTDFPFSLSFHDRVSIWHQMIHSDQVDRHIVRSPFGRQHHIEIRRAFLYEDAFEKLSPENVPDMRGDIRISLVNVVGVQEAGVDGGGLLREFLTEVSRAAVDPNRGFFRVDSRNRLYPNPVAKRICQEYRQHFFLIGRLVGKALYSQILLELPLAAFFLQLCAFGSVSSAVDYLETLDPELHENLLKLRKFDRDALKELALDFTIDSNELGETKLVELKPGGADMLVDETNLTEYIHLVADYKINREIQEECYYFRCGLLDVVPILRIFSWKEMQTLISGSDKPIDVQDWKANTNYGSSYSPIHPTIEMFWNVVENFDEAHLRKLLKFVTSCSRPPILGFKDLVPKFGISNAGVTDRLPTASTCMNLLKLPELTDIDTLRERLVYAISAQAGFELS
ncbi:Ubiquitin-protein ligase E3C [Orchesella cincta]|uniref:HECT-type E3 ubiquitin transferase n=1 Tax=Orchesella cincta TaxID=48709 RepID=A0A1D2M8V5_ORCCI|nr:Ubiquitin-protein ligase E3C [Orchesella cincta]